MMPVEVSLVKHFRQYYRWALPGPSDRDRTLGLPSMFLENRIELSSMRGKRPTPPGPWVLPVAFLILSLVVGNWSVAEVQAQGCSATSAKCTSANTDIGLRQAAFFGVGIGAMMILDEIVWQAVSDSHGPDGSLILEPFRALGDGAAMAIVSGGTFLAGLATGDEDLTRTGERLLATMALAAGAVHVTKFVFGRSRPYEGEGALSFNPGTPGSSFY